MNEIKRLCKNRMFSLLQVTVATFLGAPIAGAILMYKNYKEMRDYRRAKQIIVIGTIGTLALCVIAFFLPDKFPNMLLPMASVIGIQGLYRQKQTEYYESHIFSGGSKGSWGITIFTGIICMIVFFALIFGIVMLLPEEMIN